MAETPVDLSPFRSMVSFSGAPRYFVWYSYFDPQDGSSFESIPILDENDPDAQYVNTDRQARIDGWSDNVRAELEAGGTIILQVYRDEKFIDRQESYTKDGMTYTSDVWHLIFYYEYHHQNWLDNPAVFDDDRVRRYLEFASSVEGADWLDHVYPPDRDRFGFRKDEGPTPL